MAYVGQGIKGGTFTVLDTSGNTYNGSNTTFNLGTQVGSPAQLLVSHDGVIQKPVTDYTIATGGTQITFTTAPASGASIFITEISGAVGAPMNRDINGDELILDADADTSITADTDDQIDIRIAGADDFQFTANTFTAQSGSTITTPTLGVGTARDLGVLHVRSADSSGGVSGDADELVLENSGHAGLTIASGNSSNGNIYFSDSGNSAIGYLQYGHDNNDLEIATNDNVSLKIHSDGDVNIGGGGDAATFTNEASLHVTRANGQNADVLVLSHESTSFDQQVITAQCSRDTNNATWLIMQGRNGGGQVMVIKDSGDLANTNNTYGSLSDSRVKQDVADANSQWDDIKALKIRKYKLKKYVNKDGADNTPYHIGVIAQELEASGMNGLVDESKPEKEDVALHSDFGTIDSEGSFTKGQNKKEVKYSILYMKAIKALQEAQTRIETLETKVKALEDA